MSTLPDPGTETPIHDALALETFREQLRAWDCEWADGEAS